MMKRHSLYFIISLLVFASGCTLSGDLPIEPEIVHPGSNIGNATIQLDISLLDMPQSKGTRADDVVSDTTYFETATPSTELINTLRVLIIDGDGFVEHNKFIALDNAVAYGNIKFKVKANDTKQIYIFANELPVDWEGKGYYNFNKLITGDTFNKPEGTSPKDEIESLVVKANSKTQILFDNSGDEKINIPINEHFEFHVGEAPTEDGEEGTENNPYIFNCFITRAATIFSFTAQYEGADSFKEAINIKKINISAIGNQEYLLPKGTTYSPKKDEESTNPEKGRFITAYEVPDSGTENSTFTFPVNFDFKIENKDQIDYSPEIYFSETKFGSGDTPYLIQIVTGDGEFEFESDWKILPNLPRLARNTHVIVNFKLNSQQITCNVEVVPYVEISLDPVFGDFGDLGSPIISWPVQNLK